jgi:hypothetical protein
MKFDLISQKKVEIRTEILAGDLMKIDGKPFLVESLSFLQQH